MGTEGWKVTPPPHPPPPTPHPPPITSHLSAAALPTQANSPFPLPAPPSLLPHLLPGLTSRGTGIYSWRKYR